ncbi:MAG: GNAT family N-acetyltransferase [Chitinophagales bacterium]|nr:GNAT family N-acetyltransferase [Chitinophagales bacterium]
MTTEITIQILEPIHSKQYRNLRLLCLETCPEKFGTTIIEEAAIKKLKWEDWIKKQHELHFMAGAFFENNLIGIVGFERKTRMKTKHKGEIVQMFVRKEHEAKNIGSRLLKFIIEKCFSDETLEELTLSVVKNNTTAIHLYEKAGFVKYAVEENYFKVGDQYTDQQFMRLQKVNFRLTKN